MREKNVKGKKKEKIDIFTLTLYTSWVWRTIVLDRETRRLEQQASDPFMVTEVVLRVDLGYPLQGRVLFGQHCY